MVSRRLEEGRMLARRVTRARALAPLRRTVAAVATRVAERVGGPAATLDPVSLPGAGRPEVLVDGVLDGELSAALLELRVDARLDAPARCEAVFANWGPTGYRFLDRARLDFGRDLEIRVGRFGAALFHGPVHALETRVSGDAPPSLAVRAADRLADLDRGRRSRTFTDARAADLVVAVAQGHGLDVDCDLAGEVRAEVHQAAESDLALLRREVRAAGGHLWVQGSTLVARPGPRVPEPIALALGAGLRSATIAADRATQRTALVGDGWSVADAEALRAEATDGALDAGDLGGATGAGLLAAAGADAVDRLPLVAVDGPGEAARSVEAGYRRRARRFLAGRGEATGAAALVPGGRVALSGLGAPYDGAYDVVAVTHRFDPGGGLRTEFETERSWIGEA